MNKKVVINISPRDSLAIPVDEIHVAEWSPDPEVGRTPPTQVHILFNVPGIQFIVRLKSARACDELIDALTEHRKGVWGEAA